MRIIEKLQQKIKSLVEHPYYDEVMWLFIIMFVGIGSFFGGMLYERNQYLERHPIEVTYSQEALDLWNEYQEIKTQDLEYFASKNGTVVYPVGCSKGDRIKEENKVFFSGLGQALAEGYREVTGC